jgi:hypothetical protein
VFTAKYVCTLLTEDKHWPFDSVLRQNLPKETKNNFLPKKNKKNQHSMKTSLSIFISQETNLLEKVFFSIFSILTFLGLTVKRMSNKNLIK